MSESLVVLVGIGILLYGLVRLLPDKPMYLHPCGNKKCKRLKLESSGSISQSILEGMGCPICKEQFLLIIKETENVADIGGDG